MPPFSNLTSFSRLKKLWHKRIPCRTFLLNSHYSHCRAPKYLHHQSPKVEKRKDTEYGWWSPEEPCTNEARKPVGRVCVWPHFSNLSRECRAWSRRVDRLLSGDPGNSESRRMTEETYCQWRRVPGSLQQKTNRKKMRLILDQYQTKNKNIRQLLSSNMYSRHLPFVDSSTLFESTTVRIF